jgi:para-nitrobenzyl esterase
MAVPPFAGLEATWHAYRDGQAFLELRAPPRAGKNLLPGTFELHEEVIARRRAAGTQYWYVNVGMASQALPPAAGHSGEPGGMRACPEAERA